MLKRGGDDYDFYGDYDLGYYYHDDGDYNNHYDDDYDYFTLMIKVIFFIILMIINMIIS